MAAVPATGAFAASMASPQANNAGTITVTAPRKRQTGRTYTGIPIDTITTQSVVRYSDLNLHTQAGRMKLRHRIKAAAKDACSWLNQVYPLAVPVASRTPRQCEMNAVARAQPQVKAAIRAAS